ncbi:signal peptidase I [Solihabitans fulvus]|uniref:signal peptidase I n=1 Tax=Solihabitans fulvus TaxID=1892852 RepID=UPI001CB7673B|nr:signal peptidase I [Solihabitans fulvus]
MVAGATHPPPRKSRRKRSFWQELPILIGVALVLVFLIQTFVGRVYLIPSQSMEQTLHGCAGCVGDRVLVDKMLYDFTHPAPGEVVVFKGPDTWDHSEAAPRSDNVLVRWLQQAGSMVGLAAPDEEDFVKRVIAVGGQTVRCCDSSNHVIVDGKALDEPYVYWEPGRSTVQDSFAEVKVPDGYLFVMGDNRNDSRDSRYQGNGGVAGLVPVDNVIGKARFVVLPPSRWQGVGDHNPQATVLSAPAWQQAVPVGVAFAAAWPVLLLGRGARRRLRTWREGRR